MRALMNPQLVSPELIHPVLVCGETEAAAAVETHLLTGLLLNLGVQVHTEKATANNENLKWYILIQESTYLHSIANSIDKGYGNNVYLPVMHITYVIHLIDISIYLTCLLYIFL